MQYEFKLPDIGEGVAEGEILKWMVKEGEVVKEDQSLVEVMTDKVNVQIPSPKDGTIAKILVKEGEVVKVGRAILVIEFVGTAPAVPAPAEHQRPQPTPAAQVLQSPAPQDRVLAAPATRRLARELGVDITRVKGSGPGGRVTDDDLRAGSPPAAAP